MNALRWLQRRILWLLLLSYAAGALLPRPGAALRHVTAGTIHVGRATAEASLPMFMVAFLLASAGVSTNVRELKRLVHEPSAAILGLVANVAWPSLFVVAMGLLLAGRAPDLDVENLVVGLAIAGSMPIAGASATWANNSEGDITLSLGLVLASTLLSPITTPLVLRAAAAVTRGDYAATLDHLARGSGAAFLVFAVIVPSFVGIAARAILGRARILRWLPTLKALALVDLLLLNYANAALTLPRLVASPDWSFIFLALALTAAMCAGGFLIGWAIGRKLHAPRGDTIALTFAIGMNNNGTGLVLAASALGQHPLVLLPILALTLVQQTAAGVADILFRRTSPRVRPLPS